MSEGGAEPTSSRGARELLDRFLSRGDRTQMRTLIQEAQQEWEHGRLAYRFGIAFAQKP